MDPPAIQPSERSSILAERTFVGRVLRLREIYGAPSSTVVEDLAREQDECVKSLARGERAKRRGDNSFRKRNFVDACTHYTEGLRFAPTKSQLVALLYANRAACLFQLCDFVACAHDCERACADEDENSRYPREKLWKLELRRAESLVRIGSRAAIETARKLTQRLGADVDSLPDAAKASLEKIQERLCAPCATGDSSRKAQVRSRPSSLDRTDVHGEARVDGRGDLIDARRATTAVPPRAMSGGRRLVASDALQRWDVALCERAFVSVVERSYDDSRCHECLGDVSTLVPCRTCATTSFCSVECRSRAERQSHSSAQCRVERTRAFRALERDERLAVRLAMRRARETDPNVVRAALFLEARSFHTPPRLVAEAVYRMDRLARVLTHVDDERGTGDFLVGDELRRRLGDDTPAQLLPFWSLLRSVIQVRTNAIARSRVRFGRDSTREQRSDASLVFLRASLINHSCRPNVCFQFVGDSIVVRATRDIERGAPLCVSYGPLVGRHTALERHESLLLRYAFECRCDACTSARSTTDETDAKSFDPADVRRILEEARGRPPAQAVAMVEHVRRALETMPTSAVESELRAALSGECADVCAEAYVRQGDVRRARVELKRSLRFVAQAFGDDSLECAYEWAKAARVARSFATDSAVGDEWTRVAAERARAILGPAFETHVSVPVEGDPLGGS